MARLLQMYQLHQFITSPTRSFHLLALFLQHLPCASTMGTRSIINMCDCFPGGEKCVCLCYQKLLICKGLFFLIVIMATLLETPPFRRTVKDCSPSAGAQHVSCSRSSRVMISAVLATPLHPIHTHTHYTF